MDKSPPPNTTKSEPIIAASDDQRAVYRIGAVARLTGISPNTLRIWERRYELVDPGRTAKGGRLYSKHDIARLALIKGLVDQGDSISTVANLPLESLQQRIQERRQIANTQAPTTRPCSLCIVGGTLSVRVRQTAATPDHITLVGVFDSLAGYQRIRPECLVLVVEVPAFDASQLDGLRQIIKDGASATLVILYTFANQPTLDAARDLGIALLRTPISLDELWRLCLAASNSGASTPTANDSKPPMVAARRFSDEQLARLAASRNPVKCECPRHLADIIQTLNAFEDYSRQCENLNQDDTSLHAYLLASTARARSILEQSLAKIAEAKCIRY